MSRYSRIMSERHFTYLMRKSDHMISLQSLVFYVKDKITDTFRFTQYYYPHCRPIKAYLHGYDITRFLVHRSNLTNYSYYFINYAYAIGFTIRDIRAYFKGFQRVTSSTPDHRLLMERGVRAPYRRTPMVEKMVTSAQAAEASSVPFDASSPGVRIYQKIEKNPVVVDFKHLESSAFKDPKVFRAALRLACCRVTRFKILETTLELKQVLIEANLTSDCLHRFWRYLSKLSNEYVTPTGLLNLLREFAATFGWYQHGTKRFGEDNLNQSITWGDLASMGIEPSGLGPRMFPVDWSIPIPEVETSFDNFEMLKRRRMGTPSPTPSELYPF